MTTAQQKRFYFPAWAACAAANSWIMRRGRLQADLELQRGEFELWPEPAKGVVFGVLRVAETLAEREHRAVSAEDLRHGCNYMVAQEFSSSKLKNNQVTRVENLFRLLSDPWDLDAVMDWLDPREANRKSFIAFLAKVAHEGILRNISDNAFQTKDWESLPMERLRWLCKQLKGRVENPRAAKREVDPENQPF